MKIAILGSCVSRDAFVHENAYDVSGAYFPRASIISLMSDPIEIDHTTLSSEQQWRKWVVLNDYNKSTISQLASKKPKAVVLDLIEERFNLIKIKNCYLTRSDELLKVNPNIFSLDKDSIVNREDDEVFSLFSYFANLFCHKFNEEYPEVKVIIHDARYSDYYMDNGRILKFDELKCYKNKQANLRLETYVNILLDGLNNVSHIKVDKEISLASKNHQWGLSPFHYIDEYYLCFLKKIDRILL